MSSTPSRPRSYVDRPTSLRSLALGIIAIILPLTIASTARAGVRGAAGDLYVTNTLGHSIVQFDGVTGAFVCVFAETPPHIPVLDFEPGDLAWGPDGHLWVSRSGSSVGEASVLRYDGNTGAYIDEIVPSAAPIDAATAAGGLTFGPNGNMFVQIRFGENYYTPTYGFDRVSGASLGVALYSTALPDPPGPQDLPPSLKPDHAKFGSNGNFLITGRTDGGPEPTFRAYDGNTMELLQQVIDNGNKTGFGESSDGCCYLVTENSLNRVDRYDAATLQLVDTFVPVSVCLLNGGCAPFPNTDPCCFEAMKGPRDLAYGPNGNLFVVADKTWVPKPEVTPVSMGAIHEFDPITGEQIRVFGAYKIFEGELDPEKLKWPFALEFKPLPGDYASSGGAFQGDWLVDQNDFDHFQAAFTGDAIPSVNPHYLLSFDFDRDGDIDCDDWPAFAAAFEASSGFPPPTPLPDTPVFACVEAVAPGDCDGDSTVNLVDFATFATCFGLNAPNLVCEAADFACSDMDVSGSVNLVDFATFAVNFGT